MLDRLSGLNDISFRMMMGEHSIYYQGKIICGIYNDRLLVKHTPSARKKLPDVSLEMPYAGAKEMFLVEYADNRECLMKLVTEIYEELPAPWKKKQSNSAYVWRQK